MHPSASSLPESWVHSLWAELRANYGARWDRTFPVPPCPPDTDPAQHAQGHVKGIQAVWAKRLGHLQANPKAIRFALDNLPDEPPTLPEFIALCNRRPDPKPAALPAPEVNKAAASAALAKAAKATQHVGDHLTPIRALMARELAGPDHRLTKFQREFWRKAMRQEILSRHGIDTLQPFDLAALRS